MHEGAINTYAMHFTVPVPADVHDLEFSWQSLIAYPVSKRAIFFADSLYSAYFSAKLCVNVCVCVCVRKRGLHAFDPTESDSITTNTTCVTLKI